MSENLFDDRISFVHMDVDAQSGSYALEKKKDFKWENCRERFATTFKLDTEGFFFKHEENQSRSVASFIRRCEHVLQLDQYSKFQQTSWSTILWIQPSDFWKSCQMRRSLLTILLRCGMLYDVDKDNFEEALLKERYVVATKKAISRFFFGFTCYKGPDLSTTSSIQILGWKSVFENLGEFEIKNMLVIPDESSYHPMNESCSGLWC